MKKRTRQRERKPAPQPERVIPVDRPEPALLRRTLLRTLRKERECTQADLAERAGISRDHMGRLERGDEPGTMGAWAALAFALGVSPDVFGYRGGPAGPAGPASDADCGEANRDAEPVRDLGISVAGIPGDNSTLHNFSLDGARIVPFHGPWGGPTVAEGDGVIVRDRAPGKGEPALVCMKNGATYLRRYFPGDDGRILLGPLHARPDHPSDWEPLLVNAADVESINAAAGMLWNFKAET